MRPRNNFISLSTADHFLFFENVEKMYKNLLKRTHCFVLFICLFFLTIPENQFYFTLSLTQFLTFWICKTITIWNSTLKQLRKLCSHNIDPNFVFFTNLVSIVSYEKMFLDPLVNPVLESEVVEEKQANLFSWPYVALGVKSFYLHVIHSIW